MLVAERVSLQEMAGQPQRIPPFRVVAARLGVTQEGGQSQQPLAPNPDGGLGHRPAGAGRDVMQVVRGARYGALGDVESIAEIGEQGHLPTRQIAGGRNAGSGAGQQTQQSEEHARMPLSLRQRASRHSTGGAQKRERPGLRHSGSGGRLNDFAGDTAELVRQTSDPPQVKQVARLPACGASPRRPTPRKTAMDAMFLSENGDDQVALAIGATVKHEPRRLPFHQLPHIKICLCLAGGGQVLLQARHKLDEVAGAVAAVELCDQNVVPAVFDGARAAGQSEEIGAPGHTTERTGLDR